MKKRILVIDDDFELCLLLNRFLSRNGYHVEEAWSGKKGIEKFKQGSFDIVICDNQLGDKEGLEVLQEIKTLQPGTIVLIITGYTDIKTAVDLIKSGASDYITKPLVPDEILNVLNAITKNSFQDTSSAENIKRSKRQPDKEIFLQGVSKQSEDLCHQVEIVAGTDYNVILYGESGTGKEEIARTIHNLSRRKNQPFISIDCGTLAQEICASELFGHVTGAFTGALTDKEGHFELANGGTLFLDEVANLTYDIQASLLRVMQERKFKRIGGTNEIPADIRIIVASTDNLQDAYKKGKFREDLYHRFNGFSINIPSLSKRREDIPLFAEFFLELAKNEFGKTIRGFEDEVMQLFLTYSWPGNLRELKNVIRRAALITDTHTITPRSLPFEIGGPGKNADAYDNELQKKIFTGFPPEKKDILLKDTVARIEYETILSTLQLVNFNKSKAAELLNIDRKTLYNKIRNYEGNNFSNYASAG